MKNFFLVALLVLVLAACGESSTTTTVPANPNNPGTTPDTGSASIVGTWEGGTSDLSSDFSRRFVITETAGSYSSSVYVCEESFGSTCEADAVIATLSIEDNDVTMTYTEASSDFNGVVTIVGTLSGSTITGDITIVADTVGIEMGKITLTKK